MYICFIFYVFLFIFLFSFFNLIYFIFKLNILHTIWKKSFSWFCFLISFGFKAFKSSTSFIHWQLIVYTYLFSKCFAERRICKISLIYYSTLIRWQYSSPVKNSCLSVLSDDDVDILAASLLMSYCSFSFLILSSIVLIGFGILSKKDSFWNVKNYLMQVSTSVVPITKNKYGFAVHYLYSHVLNFRGL